MICPKLILSFWHNHSFAPSLPAPRRYLRCPLMAAPPFVPRGDLWPASVHHLVGGNALLNRNAKIMGWWRGAFAYNRPLEECDFPPGVTVESFLKSVNNNLADKLRLVAYFVIKTEVPEILLRDIRRAVNDHEGIPVPQRGEILDAHLVLTPHFKNTGNAIMGALENQIFNATYCIPGAASTPTLNFNFSAQQLLQSALSPPPFDVSGNAMAIAGNVVGESLSTMSLD